MFAIIAVVQQTFCCYIDISGGSVMEYMNEKQLEEKMRKIGVIPVAVLDDMETVLPTAKALCDGNLPAIEVTFRTAVAAQAIAEIKKEIPDMLVGSGTVLTPKQVNDAADAGADFLVSPGLNPRTIEAARERGIPMIPGICTPTEAEAALELGIRFVKFFPAEAAGGLAMIKAMSAPYQMLSFMPTGGISMDNLEKYLSFPKIAACGGSFMLSKELLKNKDYAKITALSQKAAKLAADIRKDV